MFVHVLVIHLCAIAVQNTAPHTIPESCRVAQPTRFCAEHHHFRHFRWRYCTDLFSHDAADVQDITPLASSSSSTRGGSTPFFTSPKGSIALSTTPFASLSECPFTEADGPSTSGSPAPAPPPPKTHTQQQDREQTVSFSSAQIDSQVRSVSSLSSIRVKKARNVFHTLCVMHGWQNCVYCNSGCYSVHVMQMLAFCSESSTLCFFLILVFSNVVGLPCLYCSSS